MSILIFFFIIQSITEIPFLEQPVSQKPDERIYCEFTFSVTSKIKTEDIYNPGSIKYLNDHIYVSDYKPYHRVLKLDPSNGDILITFGKQHGQGPEDIGHLTGFDITENGDLWIADYGNSRLAVFNQDGKSEMVILNNKIPYKISGKSTSDIIAVKTDLSSKLFLLNKSEMILWESEELVANPQKWSNIITGFVILLDNNEAIQIGNHAGYIAKYNNQGKLDYIRMPVAHRHKTIGNPVPGLDHLVYNVNRQNLDYAIANGFAYKDKLVLFVQHMGDNRFQTLDIYSISDGSYQYSYRLPESFRDIDISETGTLVGIKPEGEIQIWQLDKL
ncbi:MAG: hypothetical protein ACFCU6_06265 [Balneolaceae bacterium]